MPKRQGWQAHEGFRPPEAEELPPLGTEEWPDTEGRSSCPPQDGDAVSQDSASRTPTQVIVFFSPQSLKSYNIPIIIYH